MRRNHSMDNLDRAIVELAKVRDQIVEAAATGKELPEAALVGALGAALGMREFVDGFTYDVEMLLRRRMLDNGATLADHPDFEVALTRKPVIDFNRLTPLKELVPDDVLLAGFIAAHEEPKQVPDRWDMRVVKRWRRYGGQIAETIEAATIDGPPEIELKRKDDQR
jgi:hypothetical protein